ncbi:hypothetical protein Tco_0038150 [Tanacetum coccineum]
MCEWIFRGLRIGLKAYIQGSNGACGSYGYFAETGVWGKRTEVKEKIYVALIISRPREVMRCTRRKPSTISWCRIFVILVLRFIAGNGSLNSIRLALELAEMIDYALWEVIENGATLPKTAIMEGVAIEMPITTAKEKA